MTAALLLASAKRKVLLLERQPFIGGSMRRFKRQGVSFDTGFHFTGGIGGLLSDMLEALGIAGDIQAVPLDKRQNRIFMEDTGAMYEFPPGLDAVEAAFHSYFPKESSAISAYFKTEREIEQETPLMNLRKLNELDLPLLLQEIDADKISLHDYLSGINASPVLQSTLAASSLCYGSPPSITALSTHCRIGVGLHRNTDRIKNGGEAFIDAFLKRAAGLDISIKTGTSIASLPRHSRRFAREAILTDDTAIRFENAIMTIHPKEIAALIPQEDHEFHGMLNNLEETISFNSLFATLDGPSQPLHELSSCLSSPDLEGILRGGEGCSAMAFLSEAQCIDKKPVAALCAFSSCSPFLADQWRGLLNRRRCKEYQEYKERHSASMLARIEQIHPEYSGKIRILDSASPLSFIDYLSSSGSAYGIMHRLGDNWLLGRLPFRNFYIAGQNAMLPGLLGSMLSSFIIARYILGQNFLATTNKP